MCSYVERGRRRALTRRNPSAFSQQPHPKWGKLHPLHTEIRQNLLTACARAPGTGCSLSAQTERTWARYPGPCHTYPATGIPGCYWSDWAVCSIKGRKAGRPLASCTLMTPTAVHMEERVRTGRKSTPGQRAVGSWESQRQRTGTGSQC